MATDSIKCMFCEVEFSNAEFLLSHLERNHPKPLTKKMNEVIPDDPAIEKCASGHYDSFRSKQS